MGVDPVPEEPLAATEDDRIDQQPIFIDQLVPKQLVDEIWAAIDEKIAARLLLEPRHARRDIARDDRRVVPVGPLERVRYDVLRDAVHLLDQFLVADRLRRPERGPDLPGPTPEQERLGIHRLGLVEDLVLVRLEAERPGIATAPVLIEPGRLDDAVEGHERGDHEPHGVKTSRGGRTRPRRTARVAPLHSGEGRTNVDLEGRGWNRIRLRCRPNGCARWATPWSTCSSPASRRCATDGCSRPRRSSGCMSGLPRPLHPPRKTSPVCWRVSTRTSSSTS